MSQDAYGNYQADIEPPEDPTPPGPFGGVLSGAGAPDNSLGSNGNIYVNTTNGDVYTKSGDTWTIVSSGSGSPSSTTHGSGDPTGVVTPDAVDQIYFDTSTNPTSAYRATGLTSADWAQFI